MSESLEHTPAVQLGEVRTEDEGQGLTRTAHSERGDEQQQQDPEKDGQENPGDALDPPLDTEVHDRDRRDAECQGEPELQRPVPRLLGE